MPDTTTPQYTAVINQSVFLEPLKGDEHPRNYLDRFPEEVYNKEIDSHLVKFMYALLGPAGLGWLHRNYLEARLLFEEFGIDLFDLERFYGNPFQFGRILEEVYDEDPRGLLSQEKWNKIRAKDAAYRNRAIDFLNGVRMGNTPAGMRLIARSGLGHDVEIIENYKSLFDDYSDSPLYLNYYGQTRSTEEMVVIPRAVVPRSEIQTITIYGSPTGGTFRIRYDGRDTIEIPFDAPARTENYRTLFNTSGAPAIRVSSEELDITIEVENNAGDTALNDLVVNDAGIEQERYEHTDADLGQLVRDINAASENIVATLIADDVPLTIGGPYNLTAFTLGVQEALEALPNIGSNNVEVKGGPGPNHPFTIYFVNDLSNRDILELSTISSLTGGSSPAIVTSTAVSGVSTADETVRISDRAQHNLQTAVDRIRPQTTIPTVNAGRGLQAHQQWAQVASSSQYSTVIRYVTGRPEVLWPPRDAINWIEPAVEREAPRIKDDLQHHYQNFHTVGNVRSYNDLALEEPGYEDGTWDNTNWFSSHIGPFTPLQQLLIPEFRDLTAVDATYSADHALAEYENIPSVRGQVEVGGIVESIINGGYPASYAALDRVRPIVYHDTRFWASDEREEGDEFLEIDLGEVRPVNYVSFETTRKPIIVEIEVDRLDQTPRRAWGTVRYLDSIRTFYFAPENQSSWTGGFMRFANARGGLVYTRHLRLRFSRRVTDDSPFKNSDGSLEPWTIDVRNLRVGRNLAT